MIICDLCRKENPINIELSLAAIKTISVNVKLDICKDCITTITENKGKNIWIKALKKLISESRKSYENRTESNQQVSTDG